MNELAYNTLNLQRSFAGTLDSAKGRSRGALPAAIICLQEVLHVQLVDILSNLNNIYAVGKDSDPPSGPLWAHIGVAREDGRRKGEYSPIIYPVSIFKLLHFENIWLSPTPYRPSKGWDAGSYQSRKESIAIILDAIERLRKVRANGGSIELHNQEIHNEDQAAEGIGVFLAGDFNSFPDQEAYLAMQASDMCDIQNFVDNPNQYGDRITFTGFEPEKHKEEQGRIDFIWLGPKAAVRSGKVAGTQVRGPEAEQKSLSWIVDGYAVLPNLFEDGVYSSDHRCVVGDVVLSV